MKYRTLLAAAFLLFFSAAPEAEEGASRVYLVPQTVFVGDRAVLVIPLGGPSEDAELSPPPDTADLVFHRMRVENRGGEAHALIEFTAYAAGVLALPPVGVPSGFLAGLRVEIASVLEKGNEGRVLSDPAPPLAAPGTGFLVYGTAASLLAALFFLAGGAYWFRRHFRIVLESWKRRRLIVSALSLMRRLRREILKNPAPGERLVLLDFLSAEFRSFLARYTGLECRAMTAGELALMPLLAEGEAAGSPGFVRRWDEARYGGAGPERDELLDMLGDAVSFTGTLEKAERVRRRKAPGGSAGRKGGAEGADVPASGAGEKA
ncbi:MAG: hypothetical protein LBK08_09370 [Treponema sp.]|nr:hypothetical protein [Treponema sp.]